MIMHVASIKPRIPFDIGYADGVAPVLAMPENPVPNGSRAG